MSDTKQGNAVLEKNLKAAHMWSSGGRAYDEVSRGVSEGIRHCVMRLAPQKDERVLDIATGTGLTARHINPVGRQGNRRRYRARAAGRGTGTFQ